VMRNQSLAALNKTLVVMGTAGGTFAAIGGVFAGVACLSEDMRGGAGADS